MSQPTFFTEGNTPNRNDPKQRVITKILGRVQDEFGADNENNPGRNDTRWTLKEKWNRATWSGATPPPIMLYAKWFPVGAVGNWNFLSDNQTGDWADFNAYEPAVYQLNLSVLGIIYTERFDLLTDLYELVLHTNSLTYFIAIPPNVISIYLDDNLLTETTTIPVLPVSVLVATFTGNQLTEAAVDQILANLDSNGASNGTVQLDGGTNAIPSAAGLVSKASLEAKGWTVLVNSTSMAWVSALQLASYSTGPSYSGVYYDNLTLAAFNAVNPATVLTLQFYDETNLLTSISGMAYLVNLDTLDFYEQTHAACVSALTQIPPLVTRIYFQQTNVTGAIVFPSIPSLTFLDISLNSLMTSLDASALTSLTFLSCQACALSTLDVSALTLLTTCRAWDNGMNAAAVNAILIALDANAQINGTCIVDGTNAAPTGAGITAKNNLIGKGWAVTTT